MNGLARSINATATGQLDAGQGFVLSFGLCAGADAATAVLRTGGASGTIVGKLACAANTSDSRTFISGVPYSDLHVTLTGTAPNFEAEVG